MKRKKKRCRQANLKYFSIYLSKFQTPKMKNSFNFFFLFLEIQVQQALKEPSIYFMCITFGMTNKFIRRWNQGLKIWVSMSLTYLLALFKAVSKGSVVKEVNKCSGPWFLTIRNAFCRVKTLWKIIIIIIIIKWIGRREQLFFLCVRSGPNSSLKCL